MDPVSYIFVILICLLLSAFFSGSETALLRARPEDIEHDLQEAKTPSAVAARNLLRSTSKLLVTILMGNNIVNTLAASCASALAIHYMGDKWGIIVSTIAVTLLLLIFSELLPKAIAAQNPKKVSYMVALPLYFIHHLFGLVHLLFESTIDPLLNKFAGGNKEKADLTEQIVRLARQLRLNTNDITPASIMAGAAGAESRTVSEIMVPRTEILALPLAMTPEEALDKMLTERYTRAPIYRNSLDEFVGVIHLKDLIKYARDGGKVLQDILKPILRVPERKPILALLKEMQRTLSHIAIVKDEFGVTQGLITQEDILEELVGELRDEFDKEELESLKKISQDSYLALGRMFVLDFNRDTGWNIKAERGDTLGGVVYNLLGRAPQKGDIIQHEDYEFSVTSVHGSAIKQLVVRQLPEKD